MPGACPAQVLMPTFSGRPVNLPVPIGCAVTPVEPSLYFGSLIGFLSDSKSSFLTSSVVPVLSPVAHFLILPPAQYHVTNPKTIRITAVIKIFANGVNFIILISRECRVESSYFLTLNSQLCTLNSLHRFLLTLLLRGFFRLELFELFFGLNVADLTFQFVEPRVK